MLEAGQRISRYVIDALIGRGAMGAVYRATDTEVKQPVALKILSPESGAIEPEMHARFLREAKIAVTLNHPNIVKVFEIGEHEGLPFMAMELIEGTTLRHLVGDKSVALPMRIRWIRDLAQGLAVAHELDLVHRDVKPENVLISKDGEAKLADFGIAKGPQTGPRSFRTQTGHLVGTPDYMAPEQWASSDVDGRADQYAWGLLAYELLTAVTLPLGRPPPILSLAPDLPRAVADCVTKATEHRREDRYPSMQPIIDLLEPFIAERSDEAAQTRSLPPDTVALPPAPPPKSLLVSKMPETAPATNVVEGLANAGATAALDTKGGTSPMAPPLVARGGSWVPQQPSFVPQPQFNPSASQPYIQAQPHRASQPHQQHRPSQPQALRPSQPQPLRPSQPQHASQPPHATFAEDASRLEETKKKQRVPRPPAAAPPAVEAQHQQGTSKRTFLIALFVTIIVATITGVIAFFAGRRMGPAK